MKRCILCLAVLLLAACGASGPLYLPGTQPHKGPLKKEHRKTDGTPATAEDASPDATDQPAAPEAQPAPAAPESTPNPPPAAPQP